MITSKDIEKYAYDLVQDYCFRDVDCYNIHIADIPYNKIDVLCSMILENEPALAYESCGPDNKEYEKNMLPALKKYLLNTFNEDIALEFAIEWKRGVREYLKKNIESEFELALENYNESQAVRE